MSLRNGHGRKLASELVESYRRLMMAISSSTPLNLLFGAGNVEVGGLNIGATKEGTVFRVEQEFYWPDLNCAKGPIRGTGYKVREVAFLQFTLVEMTMENIALAIPSAAASSSDSASTIISGGVPGCPADTNYSDVIWTGENCEGKTLRITLKDAISSENMEITFQCDEEASFTLTFMATYDPGNVTVRPWYMELEV